MALKHRASRVRMTAQELERLFDASGRRLISIAQMSGHAFWPSPEVSDRHRWSRGEGPPGTSVSPAP